MASSWSTSSGATRAGKRGLEAAVEVRGAGAQARRVEVEHRRIEDEAGDGRAGRRVAVGIEGAAAERQIGSGAQADRRRDHVHVARRGHHGVARERLVGGAGAEEHRRKDGEQQTGKRRENERGEAGNDVLASHAVDFSLALSGRAGAASHVGYGQLPAAVRACDPICFYKPVPSSASCSAQHNAFFLSTRTRTTPPGALIARYDKKNQPNPLQDQAMSDPLWRPEKARAAQTTLGAFSVWMASRAAKPFADYEELHRYSTRAPWRVLVGAVGLRRRGRRQGRAALPRRRRQDAGRAVLSGRAAEFRREPAQARGWRRRRARLLGRGQGQAPHELARARQPRSRAPRRPCARPA